MANFASETQNLGHLTLKKGYSIAIGYGYDILKSLKLGYYYILKISRSKKGYEISFLPIFG
jgi:hypothetical protein